MVGEVDLQELGMSSEGLEGGVDLVLGAKWVLKL